MGFLSKMLGTERAIDTAADAVDTGIGMLEKAFFTDQEKQEFASKMFDQWLQHQKLIGEQSTPTAISRRIIAWGVLGIVAATLMFCGVLIGLGDIVEVQGKSGEILYVLTTQPRIDAAIRTVQVFSIGWAFTGVIVFYFGPHMLAKLK